MKKSEVIKLMKEGTHCIYNDCAEKEELLREICIIPREVDIVEFSHYYLPPIKNFMAYKTINLSEIEPDNEKPYLFYEGEKYYFGEEYEFRDSTIGKWQTKTLAGYDREAFISEDLVDHCYIRKIDHTTKYKKLLLELKMQAEKDGVNLKEIL